jgi:hypothetical protein
MLLGIKESESNAANTNFAKQENTYIVSSMKILANHEAKYMVESEKENFKVRSARINVERRPLIITCSYIENPLVAPNSEAESVAISYKIQ